MPEKQETSEELIDSKERQPNKNPGLFDIFNCNYASWFCFYFCCSFVAMFQLGRMMNDKRAIIYLVVGIISTLAYTSVSFFHPDSFQNNGRDTTTPFICATIAASILGLIMLILMCTQRRKFIKHQNQDEDLCVSIFAILCCSPCAYGQMGSTQIV